MTVLLNLGYMVIKYRHLGNSVGVQELFAVHCETSQVVTIRAFLLS